MRTLATLLTLLFGSSVLAAEPLPAPPPFRNVGDAVAYLTPDDALVRDRRYASIGNGIYTVAPPRTEEARARLDAAHAFLVSHGEESVEPLLLAVNGELLRLENAMPGGRGPLRALLAALAAIDHPRSCDALLGFAARAWPFWEDASLLYPHSWGSPAGEAGWTAQRMPSCTAQPPPADAR